MCFRPGSALDPTEGAYSAPDWILEGRFSVCGKEMGKEKNEREGRNIPK